jgi:protein TonB
MIRLRGYHWLLGTFISLPVYLGVIIAVLWQPPTPAIVTGTGIAYIDITLEPAGGGTSVKTTVTTADVAESDTGKRSEPDRKVVLKTGFEPLPALKPESTPEQVPALEVVKKQKPKTEQKTRRTPDIKRHAASSTRSGGKSRAAPPGHDGDSSGGNVSVGGMGKGSAESKAHYYSRLAAWLERHKRYPVAAQRRRQTGTVRVTFTIDRQGRVLSEHILSSSGHDVLDKEVMAMLRRASPMPNIPKELGHNTVTVTVPVVFDLR